MRIQHVRTKDSRIVVAALVAMMALAGCGRSNPESSDGYIGARMAFDSDSGTIDGPGVDTGGNDTGTYNPSATPTPAPTDSSSSDDGGASSGGSDSSGGDTSSNTDPTSSPVESPVDNDSSGSTGGTDSGSDSGLGSTDPQPTGSDGGVISGGGSSSGSDSGSTSGGSTGGSTSGGDTSGGGTSSGGDTSSGGTSGSGDGTSSGGTTDPSPTPGDTTGSTGGNDDGSTGSTGGSTGGSDGGSTSGGSTSGGDGGSCNHSKPCANERVKVKLNAVCPKKGAPTDRLWYSQAAHPVFAVEARVASAQYTKNPMSKFQPYHSTHGPANFEDMQDVPTVLIESIDLKAEPLFGPKFPKVLEFDYSPVAPYLPGATNLAKGWSKVLITIYVCDDTDSDGKCSDEQVRFQISNKPVTHQMCHFPSAAPVDVWHCK